MVYTLGNIVYTYLNLVYTYGNTVYMYLNMVTWCTHMGQGCASMEIGTLWLRTVVLLLPNLAKLVLLYIPAWLSPDSQLCFVGSRW